MKWIEVDVITNTFGSELVADILSDFNEEGVAIFDSNDVLAVLKSDEVIWDYIDESLLIKSDKVTVKTSFPEEGFAENYHELIARLDELKVNAIEPVGSLETNYREIDDEDWYNVWRKFYQPIKVGGITIVPEWLNYAPEPGELPVYIDPGMAFGTGEHETTRLCITLAEKYNLEDKTVLDIGCGSGILGLTAAVRGAKLVYMSDIDKVAVEAARANLAINKGIKGAVHLSQADLVSDAIYRGDLVFANITADILIRLSGDIGVCLNDGGIIILSGIIKQRFDEVLDAYVLAGYKLVETASMGEWCAIALTK